MGQAARQSSRSNLARRWSLLPLVLCLAVPAVLQAGEPRIEDYATIEAYVGKDEIPVYAFGYTCVYGIGPDLLPGVVMQEGNVNPTVKFKPKKSWEIKSNLCGSTAAREPKTMWNDDQPLRPVHLMDGDPETAWSSRGGAVPDRQPEWIRIDLPAESTVASVALVCGKTGPSVNGGLRCGKALPREITVKLSKNAKDWEIVYESKEFSGPDAGASEIKFEPRPAKQIWIIANNLRTVGNWGYAFSIGEVEVRDTEGNNLALISRGAGVQVSSTYYGYGMDRFSQDMLWPIQYDLGFKWVRVGYDIGMYLWSYVEREKGKLEIDAKADAAISDAVKSGVNVIMTLDKGNWLYRNPPKKVDWKKARVREMMETYYDHQGWPNDSPEMMKGFLRYVEYMARHFKGRVAYYDILNEWQNAMSTEEYVMLVKTTAEIIRKADPKAKIMLGSPICPPGPVTMGFSPKERGVILDCLRKGLASVVDAVGWHPFYQTDPDNPALRSYKQDILQFKKECAALGFKGQYAATEWTYAAPYPGSMCTEMQKAKYAARLMTLQCGLDVISLYNETFQTGKIDWDCTLLRNAFSVDPISPAQPQPIYYVLRSISTVLDGFRGAELPMRFEAEKELEHCAFRRGEKDLMLAAWIQGTTTDGIVETRTDVALPRVRATQAWVIDVFNGTEQELIVTADGEGAVLKGMRIKDYPTFIRVRRDR